MGENFNDTASCFLWNSFQFLEKLRSAILFESFFIAEKVNLTLGLIKEKHSIATF